MKIRVHTESGAIYLIDATAAKWHRFHTTIGILGYNSDDGTLAETPIVTIGQRMVIHTKEGETIHTTRVVSATQTADSRDNG